jgi:galacturan 1,4-alpha-galacturonidase
VQFTDDIQYWQNNNIYHPFQKSIAFWRWGGSHIRFFGGGTIDGSGQKWWDAFAANKKDILVSNTFEYERSWQANFWMVPGQR